jgi:hypothetical protein
MSMFGTWREARLICASDGIKHSAARENTMLPANHPARVHRNQVKSKPLITRIPRIRLPTKHAKQRENNLSALLNFSVLSCLPAVAGISWAQNIFASRDEFARWQCESMRKKQRDAGNPACQF